MKRVRTASILSVVMVFFVVSLASAGYKYSAVQEHAGGDITPIEACEMVKKNPEHTFLIDVRTRAEYQVIGHPKGAYNIPYKFFTTKLGKKNKYSTKVNENFGNDLKARFNPETDTLIIMCRSGKRSCNAADAAVKAGFNADKIFSIMAGFEGGKCKIKDSAFKGQRAGGGGWRLEGLPWTYNMKKELVYQADCQ